MQNTGTAYVIIVDFSPSVAHLLTSAKRTCTMARSEDTSPCSCSSSLALLKPRTAMTIDWACDLSHNSAFQSTLVEETAIDRARAGHPKTYLSFAGIYSLGFSSSAGLLFRVLVFGLRFVLGLLLRVFAFAPLFVLGQRQGKAHASNKKPKPLNPSAKC